MPSPSLRSRLPMLLAGALLAFSLFGASCKQGIGDRCEANSDCSSGICNLSLGDPLNGICCDPNNLAACMPNSGGTGGTPGSIGGSTGSGGATGTGGAGGAASDASTDTTVGDASTPD